MSLLKFFQIIENSFIGRFVDKRMELISATDPERIYVENIRSFYNFTTPIAKIFCEMAVKENLFKKMHAINCPKCGHLIQSLPYTDSLLENIECPICQMLEKDKYEFTKGEYHIVIYYKLNKKAL